MKRALYFLALLLLVGCGTTSVFNNDRERTYDASFDAVFEAALQYLQDEEYTIAIQNKSESAPLLATIRTENKQSDGQRQQIKMLIQADNDGEVNVSLSIDVEERTEQGTWRAVRLTEEESDARYQACLDGIAAWL